MDGTAVDLQTQFSDVLDSVDSPLPDALTDALALVVADFHRECQRELEALRAERRAIVAELQAENAKLGADNADLRVALRAAYEADRARISEVLSSIKSGEPGKDADPALVAEMVEAAIAKRPAPLTAEDVRGIALAEIAQGIKAMPEPQDGRSVDPEDVRRMVVEEVEKTTPLTEAALAEMKRLNSAVAKMEEPLQHAKDAAAIVSAWRPPDHEELLPLIEDVVQRRCDTMPVPKNGEPGKDADLTQVRAFIIEELEAAYKAVPIPKDGHTPTEEELAPLIERAALGLIDVLPVPKNGDPGEPGRDGLDGKDAEPVTAEQLAEVARPLLTEMVTRHFEENPPPAGEKGEPGRDGVDGQDAEPLAPEAIEAAVLAHPEMFATAAGAYLEANPPPAGKDGQDGSNGKDAEPVSADEVAEALRPALAEEVSRYLETNPPPAGKDGESIQGEPGPPGEPGRDGKDADPEEMRAFIREAVKSLPVPQDGHTPTPDELAPLVKEAVSEGLAALPQPVHLKKLLIDRAGLVAVMSDGSTDDIGPVVGKDGEPGKDASLPDVAAMIAEEFGKIQADVSAGREPPVAPEDVAEKVGKAIYLLNESPPIEQFKAWPAQEGQSGKSMEITRGPNGLRVKTIND